MKHPSSPFNGRYYASVIIPLYVRWCWRFQLSYRDIEEMMKERGLDMDRSTVFRRVQRERGGLKGQTAVTRKAGRSSS